MSVTVRFTKKCAGRDPGHQEEVFDETLAQAWVDAGVAERIDGGYFVPPTFAQEVAAPPKHRAIRGPRRSKRGR